MKGYAGNPEFRLIQIFLGKSEDEARVYEVYLHISTDTFRCTCPGFKLRRCCKHTLWVERQVEEQGGYIAAVMVSHAEMTRDVFEDPIAFRQWLYDNGRVLMLE